MSTTDFITKTLAPESRRLDIADALFGINFPLQLEPAIYQFAGHLSCGYLGGYWHFYTLSNGGFYMAPRNPEPFRVSCPNGYEGCLSADALGITACLYAFSHISFSEGSFGEECGEHYHRLREFALGLKEMKGIFAAID